MKQKSDAHINRDKVAGFAAAMFLHAVVLYGLWSYHIIPPPSEALTVFVSYISPAAPARIEEPGGALKPVQPRQPTPKAEPPTALRPLAPEAPAALPAAPTTAPAQVTRMLSAQPPTPTAVVPHSTSLPTAAEKHVAKMSPVLMTGELSVSCPERPAPAYPRLSSRLGEQGKTVVLVELDELGQVINVEVKTTSGFPRLDEAAITAVKKWHCTPARRNGVAVRSFALQPFNFTLKGR